MNTATRHEYYITRYRDGEDTSSLGNDVIELFPEGKVDGFRGFIIKVVGTKELLSNYTNAFGSYWAERKIQEEGSEQLSMWASKHSVFQWQSWF